jgi:hypothetical protein
MIDALIEKHPHWRAPQPASPKIRRGLTSGATTATRKHPIVGRRATATAGLESNGALRTTDGPPQQRRSQEGNGKSR